jgi:hypothetical protein
MIEKEYDFENKHQAVSEQLEDTISESSLHNEILMIDGQPKSVFDVLLAHYDYQDAQDELIDSYLKWGKICKAGIIIPLTLILMAGANYALNLITVFNTQGIWAIRIMLFLALSALSLGMVFEPMYDSNSRYLKWIKKVFKNSKLFRKKESAYLAREQHLHEIFKQKKFQYQYLAQLEYRKNHLQEKIRIKDLNYSLYPEEYKKITQWLKQSDEYRQQLILMFSSEKNNAIKDSAALFYQIEMLHLKIKREFKVFFPKEEKSLLSDSTDVNDNYIQTEFMAGYEAFLDKNKIKDVVRTSAKSEKKETLQEKADESQLASKLKSYL